MHYVCFLRITVIYDNPFSTLHNITEPKLVVDPIVNQASIHTYTYIHLHILLPIGPGLYVVTFPLAAGTYIFYSIEFSPWDSSQMALLSSGQLGWYSPWDWWVSTFLDFPVLGSAGSCPLSLLVACPL